MQRHWWWPFHPCCCSNGATRTLDESGKSPLLQRPPWDEKLYGITTTPDTKNSALTRVEPDSDTEMPEALHILCCVLQDGPLTVTQQCQIRHAINLLDRASLRGDADAEDTEEIVARSSVLDEATKAFLIGTFSAAAYKDEKASFKRIAKKVTLAGRFSNGARQHSPLPDEQLFASYNDRLLKELALIDSLSDFNIFQVKEQSIHGPLEHVSLAVIITRNFHQTFKLSSNKLLAFLRDIEGQYLAANPYHNALHAADVVQGVHMLVASQRDSCLEDIEVFSAILASIGHDVGHPGVSNAFCVAMRDEASLVYNDISVCEMMHACLLYRTLNRAGCEMLEHLDQAQATLVRKMIISMILATDMVHHFDKVKEIETTVKEKGTDVRKWDSSLLALEMVVHAADISNVTRPYHVADQWVDRVLLEFFQQGDRERKLGMPMSPLCDRRKVTKASSQPGFIDFIVKPLFSQINVIINVDAQLGNMELGKANWSKQDRRLSSKSSKTSSA